MTPTAKEQILDQHPMTLIAMKMSIDRLKVQKADEMLTDAVA